jgi:FG-GAP-like repeat
MAPSSSLGSAPQAEGAPTASGSSALAAGARPYAPKRLPAESSKTPACAPFVSFYSQHVEEGIDTGMESAYRYSLPERGAGAVDVNGDGQLDLVFDDQRFLATGYRSFYPNFYLEGAPPIVSAALGDINADGVDDAVVEGWDNFSERCVLPRLGNAQGLRVGVSCLMFDSTEPLDLPVRGRDSSGLTGPALPCTTSASKDWGKDGAWRACPLSVDIADLDGDGRQEIAGLDREGKQISRTQMHADGSLRLLPAVSLPSKPLWWSRAAINDGLERDHVIVTESAVLVLDRNQLRPRVVLEGGFVDVAVRDLTKDGVRELLAITANGLLTVLRGRGNGQFEPMSRYLLRAGDATVTGLFLADLDADLLLDAVVVSNGFAVAWGLGDGRLSAPVLADVADKIAVRPKSIDPNHSDSTFLDLDDDGQLERATKSGHAIVVQQGIGPALFYPPQEVSLSEPLGDIQWYDLNGDTLLDLSTLDAKSGARVAFLAQHCPRP